MSQLSDGSERGSVTMLPALLALGAAVCFSVSTAVQHHCAGDAGGPFTNSLRLLGRLLRRPLWLAGLSASIVGFGLHAAAVGSGALALVQPILVLAVVFALPVRAALDRSWPSGLSLVWAGVTAAGLALFLIAARPSHGSASGNAGAATWLIAVWVSAAALTVRASRHSHRPVVNGLLLGSAAGMLFGLVSGVLKLVVIDVGQGWPGPLWWWHLGILFGLGMWGLAVNQRAYSVAPLAVSLPVLNIIDPLVAIVFGAVVFGEKPADDPWSVVAELAGLLLMAGGVVGLCRPERRAEPGSDGVLAAITDTATAGVGT